MSRHALVGSGLSVELRRIGVTDDGVTVCWFARGSRREHMTAYDRLAEDSAVVWFTSGE